jgi:hypothetical protein
MVSDLIVLDRMCEKQNDIRMARLPDNLISARKVKRDGEVTIGVDAGSADRIMRMELGVQEYGACLIIYNREQFEAAKAELEAVKPWSTLKEMFPGEFSGALPGSIESKWAAEKQVDPAAPGARMHTTKVVSDPMAQAVKDAADLDVEDREYMSGSAFPGHIAPIRISDWPENCVECSLS